MKSEWGPPVYLYYTFAVADCQRILAWYKWNSSCLQTKMQNTTLKKLLINKMAKSKVDGFSLIELVIVVAVLAVLAAIAIPAFNNVSKNARSTAAKTTLANIYKECEVSRADSGTARHVAVAATASGVTYSGDAILTTCAASSVGTTSDGCVYTLYNNAVTVGEGAAATTSAAGTKGVTGTGCAVW